MRVNRHRSSALEALGDEIRMLFIRRAGQVCGLALLAIAAAGGAALASWSAADPSLNHATHAAPTNLLGHPGAIVADLLIQTLGLGAAALLVPIILWGMRIFSRRGVDQESARLAAWLFGGVLAAGAAAALPPPPTWPLPTGLGGLAGDVLLGVFKWILSPLLSGFAAILGAIVLSVSAVFTIAFAGLVDIPALVRGDPAAPPPPALPRLRVLLFRALRAAFTPDDEPPEPAPPKAPPPGAPPPSPPGGGFHKPPAALFGADAPRPRASTGALEAESRQVERALEIFGVRGEIVGAIPGPVVTKHELRPAPGVKSARVIGLAGDIGRSMNAESARITADPGQGLIGIELPNPRRDMIRLRDLLFTPDFSEGNARLPLALGRLTNGDPIVADFVHMPHLLVAGAAGSGKTVALNAMILSLLYSRTPEECRLILIDPKGTSFHAYDGVPHLLAPVAADAKAAVGALRLALREMEDRYRKMTKLGVSSIESFNRTAREAGGTLTRDVQTGFDARSGKPIFEREELRADPSPPIVVFVDGTTELLESAGAEIEPALQRLAEAGRPAGLHLAAAARLPAAAMARADRKIFPSRLCFRTASRVDSRAFLGEPGAEQLLGHGDALATLGGGRIARLHVPFVCEAEIAAAATHWKRQRAIGERERDAEETADRQGLAASA